MIAHYFKLTFRHFRKHLLISLLNVTGLAVGIASFILIMLYVSYEQNYDKFNRHYDDIYRIAVDAKFGNTEIRQTWTPAPLPAAMYEEFPEIEAITRIADWPQTIRTTDRRFFNEKRAAMVDSSFTDIFTLNFLEGSGEKQLNEPGQVLMDRSTASKYFGNESALGQQIFILDTIPLTVSGVYEDIPSQAHFHFNMLISLVSHENLANGQQWFNNSFETYLRLGEGFPDDELEAKLPAFVDKYLFEGNYGEHSDEDNYWKYYLQHIAEIHLGSDLNGEFEANGNLVYVRIFWMVAILVLIVACINFMNLTTASSATRAREIGVRKTNGAGRGLLRQQFFAEAVLVTFLALLLALGLVEGLLGLFRNFTGKEIDLHYLDNFLVIPGLLALAILVGFFSGTYPAFYMSSFSAVDSLGYKGVKQGRSWFRDLLVLFQFSVSIFLIASTLLVQEQMNLIMDEELGFDKEHVLLVTDIHYMDQPESWRNELLELPGIVSIGFSSDVPGDQITNWGFGAEAIEKSFSLNVTICDEHYQEAMAIPMVQGRFFSEEYGDDASGIVLNETAVRDLGLGKEVLGRDFYLWNDRNLVYKVIGVVKDHHWESKHSKVRPMGLMLFGVAGNNEALYMSVRYSKQDPAALIKALEKGWDERIEEIPFNYEFLDDHYAQMYNNEQQTLVSLYLFAGIAIFISCLGLFGLAAFMAERRTKEVGIRKCNGATTLNIVRLLSLDFTKWVLVANLVAWPLTWLAMRKWLESFAYRVGIPVWIFLLAGALAFIVAILTVSFHAIKASRTNPGISLRYE